MATIQEALAVGLAQHKADRLAEAEAVYRKVLEVQPDNFDALHLLGLIMRRHGNDTEAVTLIYKALQHTPDNADACYNLGNALRNMGRLEEALRAYQQALILKPGMEALLTSIGNCLMDMSRPLEAVEVYRRATQLYPASADPWSNLGAALRAVSQLDEAIIAFRQAITVDATSPGAYNNLAMTFLAQGHMAEAVTQFRRALALHPGYSAAHSNLLLCLNYDANLSNAELLAEHAAWDARHGRGAVTPLPALAPATVGADPERLLRVGYVSADLGRHPVGYYLASVLPNHDPAQVETVIYAGRLSEDDLTARFRQKAHMWHSTVGWSDDKLARQIREDRIDILVDLAGHTAGNRLPVFARKPTPLQVAWIGYFNTTGLSSMDYVLMDPVTVPPGEERWFIEKVLRLPDGRFCYAPPEYAPLVVPPPSTVRGYVTFGSFNNLSKVTDDVIRVWADVLHAVPDSRMLIKWQTLIAASSEGPRLRAAFAAAGIAPERIELRSASHHVDMLGQYGDIDIALDTFPFCGGLTSCEALWMGVPIITLPGPRPVSRQTLGFLTAIGLDEFAATSPAHYVALARALALDDARRVDLRAGQRARMAGSPLCDGPRFARHLEAQYRMIWRDWCGAHAEPALAQGPAQGPVQGSM